MACLCDQYLFSKVLHFCGKFCFILNYNNFLKLKVLRFSINNYLLMKVQHNLIGREFSLYHVLLFQGYFVGTLQVFYISLHTLFILVHIPIIFTIVVVIFSILIVVVRKNAVDSPLGWSLSASAVHFSLQNLAKS